MPHSKLDAYGLQLVRWPPPRRQGHRSDQRSKPGKTVSSELKGGAQAVDSRQVSPSGAGREPNARALQRDRPQAQATTRRRSCLDGREGHDLLEE